MLVPKRIARNHLPARVGRFRNMPPLHALAFAMVTHPRLGRGSTFESLLPELVKRVIESGRACPQGQAGKQAAIVRLLGGGLMLQKTPIHDASHSEWTGESE
jgi:hypothetical protein